MSASTKMDGSMRPQSRRKIALVVALCVSFFVAWNVEVLSDVKSLASGSGGAILGVELGASEEDLRKMKNSKVKDADAEDAEENEAADENEEEEEEEDDATENEEEKALEDEEIASHSVEKCRSAGVESPEVEERIWDQCKYFIDKLDDWRNKAAGKDTKIVSWQQASGAGDRLAGLVSVFYYGLSVNKKIQLNWQYLDAVLKPSCFMKGIFTINSKIEEHRPANRGPCMQPSCLAARQSKDICEDRNVNLVDHSYSIRACCSAVRCTDIVKTSHHPVTLKDTVACPLRMLFDYTETFLNSPVQYVLEGTVHNSTLKELEQMLKNEYRTIAFHYRSGDSEMASGSARHITNSKTLQSEYCIDAVDKFMAERTLAATNETDPRPVKWIVASDNEGMREHFRSKFPEKVIQLLIHPAHISKTKTSDPVHKLINIFQEFYLLGIADEMITTYRLNRMSAYSKFAWLFNLKSQAYVFQFKSTPCKLMEMNYDGNTGRFPSTCWKGPEGKDKTQNQELPQDHMEYYRKILL